MLFWMRQIYFTTYLIFYKLGGDDWTADVNKGKGIVGVTLLEAAILLSLVSWIGVLCRLRIIPHIPRWESLIVFLSLYLANRYILTAGNRAVNFERTFLQLSKPARRRLVAASIALVIADVAVFVCSAIAYRKLVVPT